LQQDRVPFLELQRLQGPAPGEMHLLGTQAQGRGDGKHAGSQGG
jgi:hypothetical protein